MNIFNNQNMNKDNNSEASTSFNFMQNRSFIKHNAESREKAEQEQFETVKNLFQLAKQESYIRGPIQQVMFSDPFYSADYKLLEVSKSLAEEILRPGSEFIIRGKGSDFVVGCTKDKSYQVKEVESSNSHLIVPILKMKDENAKNMSTNLINTEVCSISKTYLEFTEMEYIFSTTLSDILHDHILDIDDENTIFFSNEEKLTFKMLLDNVQLSEMELINELKKKSIIVSDGFYYLLSSSSQRRILDVLIELCDDFSTPDILVNKINPNILNEKLPFIEPFRASITNWILENFCDKESENLYTLNEKKISRARGKEILESNKKKEFPINEFKKLVQRILPLGFEPHIDCFSGIAFFDENLVTGKTVRSLGVDDLPTDLHKRLQYLFSFKKLWKKEDIEPYVIHFCANPSKIEEFLLKYCRVLCKNNEKFFMLKQI